MTAEYVPAPHLTCIDVSAPHEVEKRYVCGVDCLAPAPAELAYRQGFQDGYEQAEAAANQSWRGRAEVKVFHGGAWLNGPTAAERKAERVEILTEGHAAGLHVGLRAVDCPKCMTDAQSQLQHNRHYDAPSIPMIPGDV